MPADAPWATGPSLDGKGAFTVSDPPPALGPEPELQPAPPAVHAGIEATGPEADGSVVDQMAGRLEDAVEKVTG